MTLFFVAALILIAAGAIALMVVARIRLLDSVAQSHSPISDSDRYRPMLRLLSDADLAFASGNRALRGKVRARRRDLFRGYLRCLTLDYARLLSGVRRVMVESGVDRPDLAKALAKNRLMFAFALCRIELCLQLHVLGIAKVDVSGLMEALDSLRCAVNAMSAMAPMASGAAY